MSDIRPLFQARLPHTHTHPLGTPHTYTHTTTHTYAHHSGTHVCARGKEQGLIMETFDTNIRPSYCHMQLSVILCQMCTC